MWLLFINTLLYHLISFLKLFTYPFSFLYFLLYLFIILKTKKERLIQRLLFKKKPFNSIFFNYFIFIFIFYIYFYLFIYYLFN